MFHIANTVSRHPTTIKRQENNNMLKRIKPTTSSAKGVWEGAQEECCFWHENSTLSSAILCTSNEVFWNSSRDVPSIPHLASLPSPRIPVKTPSTPL
ncbi:hypothetical protein CDAR_43811 [Caerostris darwini]|uniref:Ycf15 n=1 Tax=Caerostris darwini TaxID=1538125 RepID=A0AAV4WGJ6_9ARAC|nr:hypothetical protein CDAR_43811 [Caerostris darwini]